MAAEEPLHPLDRILPGDGIAAGRRAAAIRHVGVAALTHVTRWPVAVERMVGARIDLDRHRIARGIGCLGKLRAMLGWGPIVLLADEDEERRHRLVGADIARHRAVIAELAVDIPIAIGGTATGIERDARGKA